MTLDNIKEASVKLCEDNPLIINGTKKIVPNTKGLSNSFNFREGILSFVDEEGALYVTRLTNDFAKTLLAAKFKWIKSLYVPFRKENTVYSCDGYEEIFAS